MTDAVKILMEMNSKIASIETSIADIKEDLKDHMAKTEENELRIEMEVKDRTEDIYAIKKHIYMVRGAVGLLTIAGTVAGFLLKFGLI